MRLYPEDERDRTLASLLESTAADQLRKIVTLTGQKAPTRRADMAEAIVRHLEGDRLRSVWEGLDTLQRAAVAEVVHSPSDTFKPSRFQAKYGASPNWGSDTRALFHAKPSSLAFFFYDNIMPTDLKARLKSFVPRPRKTEIAFADELPDTHELHFKSWNQDLKTYTQETESVPLAVHERERAAQRELASVLRLVDAGKIAVSAKTRRASGAAMQAITPALEGGDYYPVLPVTEKWNDENTGPIRAFAWPMLIQAGGLAQLSGSRLQLTSAGRKALSAPAAFTMRALWEKWKKTTLLDELARIECVKGQTGKGKRGLTAVSGRRAAIADSLAECPIGGWIDTDDLFRYMRAMGTECEVALDAWALYICEPQYGSLGYDGSADLLPGRYTMAVLLEYAATLGMMDVALIPPAGAREDYSDLWGTDELPFFSRYDGVMYFRLTPLGAYCLGAVSEYQKPPEEVKPVLRVFPDLEIAADDVQLEAGDRLALDSYAIPIAQLVWRLDGGKLIAAIEAGRQIEEVREFLTARSGAPLPDEVARLLDEVAERSTKVRDRGLARLIECADSALATRIADDPRTGKHCMHAGDRLLVVRATSEAAFRRALRECGYLVAAESNPPKKGKVRPVVE